MEFFDLFFVILSIVVIGYLLYLFFYSRRVSLKIEIFFLVVYGLVLFIFLFPQSLNIIEDVFGLDSAINFIVYLSIFIAYFLLFVLYKKSEEQRSEITKLTREISYLKKEKKENRKK